MVNLILLFRGVFAAFIMLGIFSGFMEFRTPSSEVLERFKEKGIDAYVKDVHINDRRLRYYETGFEKESPKALVVFIHGAPGSSQDYLQFLEDSVLLSRFHMVTVDRPGYGYSGFGKSIPEIGKQAELIGGLVSQIREVEKLILVGHSFGGPVAAKMAAMYPKKINTLIMLAPALDPREEKFISLAKFCEWPIISFLTPSAWKVAADEKVAHVKELEAMESDWSGIKAKVIHMHGTKDSLVPYANIRLTEDQMTNAEVEIITLEGADHFLPWSHTQLVKELLLKEAL